MSCEYHPFVGSGNFPQTIPGLIARDHVTFLCGSDTIDIRNPEFQDSRIYSYTRINRTTLSGATELFTDPQWPKNVSFNLSFTTLGLIEAQNFKLFLLNNAGKLTLFTDFWSLEWQGVITTPDAEFTNIGVCNIGVNINFKGEYQG